MSRLLIRQTSYRDPISKELVSVSKLSYVRNLYSDRGYLFWLKRMQSRSFNHISFPDELSPTVGFYYFVAVRAFNYMDNCLTVVNNRHSSKRFVTVNDLMVLWKLNLRQTLKNIRELIRLNLLRKADRLVDNIKYEVFVVNPLQFTYGDHLSYWLYEVYRDVLRNNSDGLSTNVVLNMELKIKKNKEEKNEESDIS